MGSGGLPGVLRHHLHDRNAAHPVDDDGRALPHGDPRHSAQHRVQRRQRPHVRFGAELRVAGAPVRGRRRGAVVLRRDRSHGLGLRLRVPPGDARQEAIRHRRLLQLQHRLPGTERQQKQRGGRARRRHAPVAREEAHRQEQQGLQGRRQ